MLYEVITGNQTAGVSQPSGTGAGGIGFGPFPRCGGSPLFSGPDHTDDRDHRPAAALAGAGPVSA